MCANQCMRVSRRITFSPTVSIICVVHRGPVQVPRDLLAPTYQSPKNTKDTIAILQYCVLTIQKTIYIFFSKSRCQCICPLPMFFFRPLIGPEVTWSVQGLSLVDPPPHFFLLFFWEKSQNLCKKKLYTYIEIHLTMLKWVPISFGEFKQDKSN